MTDKNAYHWRVVLFAPLGFRVLVFQVVEDLQNPRVLDHSQVLDLRDLLFVDVFHQFGLDLKINVDHLLQRVRTSDVVLHELYKLDVVLVVRVGLLVYFEQPANLFVVLARFRFVQKFSQLLVLHFF